jgi:protein TonB
MAIRCCLYRIEPVQKGHDMNSQATQFETDPALRISPARTSAISVALILHISAIALLMAPVRPPDAGLTRAPLPIEVLMPELVRPIPPPPLAPILPPTVRPTPVTRNVVARLLPVSLPTPVVLDAGSEYVEPVAEALTTTTTTTTDPGDPVFAPEQIGAASYLHAPPPRYPTQARNRGIEGDVLLLVTIAADGAPEAISVHVSSGHAPLDKAALDQVQRRWRFRPALIDGRPTRTRALVPISFRLLHD